MNKYIYMVGLDGVIRPQDAKRMWDAVPTHHTQMIEEYENWMGSVAGGTVEYREHRAMARQSDGHCMYDAGHAMVELALGTVQAVCVWAQIEDENFGPTGKYAIFE